jgi:hypothetical protein
MMFDWRASSEMKLYDSMPKEKREFARENSHLFSTGYINTYSMERLNTLLPSTKHDYLKDYYGEDHPGVVK